MFPWKPHPHHVRPGRLGDQLLCGLQSHVQMPKTKINRPIQ